MMAGLALYSPIAAQGRIVAGAAFTHCITQGLGMMLAQYEWDRLPRDGEVGQIVHRGLRMYAEILEASNQTSKFVQAMSLMEFLAYPDQFEKFEEVKKIIARYSAKMQTPEYHRLLNRFKELTGLEQTSTDPATGKVTRKHLGYRTRIVHLGVRLEQILPHRTERAALFTELQSYLRPIFDDMIRHSEMPFKEYQENRDEIFRNDDVPF